MAHETPNNDSEESDEYTLEDVIDEVEALGEMVNERLRRIEENSRSTARWTGLTAIILVALVILSFIGFNNLT
jgi:hypothetical protein